MQIGTHQILEEFREYQQEKEGCERAKWFHRMSPLECGESG